MLSCGKMEGDWLGTESGLHAQLPHLLSDHGESSARLRVPICKTELMTSKCVHFTSAHYGAWHIIGVPTHLFYSFRHSFSWDGGTSGLTWTQEPLEDHMWAYSNSVPRPFYGPLPDFLGQPPHWGRGAVNARLVSRPIINPTLAYKTTRGGSPMPPLPASNESTVKKLSGPTLWMKPQKPPTCAPSNHSQVTDYCFLGLTGFGWFD